MMDLKQRIAEFAKYEKNWNSYGADPFKKDVIDNAYKLEQYLYRDTRSEVDVFPTGADTIQFEYHRGDDYLEIEVGADSYDMFSCVNGITDSRTVPTDKLYEVINIIKLFHNPCTYKMCVFTGAFNPCTIAHYHMIESANRAGNFDYIVFAVSNQRFLERKQRKRHDWAFSEDERLSMILAMTYNNPKVLIYGVEQGYTYEVLCDVKKRYGCKSLYFALGSDKLNEIGRWGYHDNLLTEFCFYILQRNDDIREVERKCAELFCRTNYVIGQDNDRYKDVSATQIRRKIERGENYGGLIVPEVEKVLKTFKH